MEFETMSVEAQDAGRETAAAEESFWAGDEDWTEVEEVAAEAPEADQPTEELQQQDPQPEAEQEAGESPLELVYNGEKLSKPRAEWAVLAQKGMNYDKAVERATAQGRTEGAAPYRQTMETLQGLADSTGMTVEQMLEQLTSMAHTSAVARLVDRGTPEAEAEELVRLREADNRSRAQQARTQQEQAQQAASTREKGDRWRAFVDRWPELVESYSKGEAPQAFREALERGASPVEAQLLVELEQAKSENRRLQENEKALTAAAKNRKSAPGAVGGFGGKDERDEFERYFEED